MMRLAKCVHARGFSLRVPVVRGGFVILTAWGLAPGRGRRGGGRPLVGARVVEGRRVPAHALVCERELLVVDPELRRDELLARPVVPRDHAGDRPGPVEAVADPDAHVVADPQALPPSRVVDLD